MFLVSYVDFLKFLLLEATLYEEPEANYFFVMGKLELLNINWPV